MAEVERIADNARSRRILEELLENALRNIKNPMKIAIWEFGRAETLANAVKGHSLI